MIYLFLILLGSYILLFLYSLKIKDNSIVDVFWWLGFIIIAIFEFIYFDTNITHLLVLLTIVLWWTRLMYHIWYKKLQKPWEDPRYWVWRQQWKYFKTRSFFQVYILQMILLIFVSIPLYFIFTWELNILLLVIGIIISLFWFIYETLADYQLSNYIKSNNAKNMIFTEWLFRYSRHPNYFWEILFWLWITIISFSNTYYWIIWFLIITGLLLFVSWVPLKEKRYSKKDNYLEYKSKTPLLIPNFFK
jgi:steroid 5-alpha reductase family enzyme